MSSRSRQMRRCAAPQPGRYRELRRSVFCAGHQWVGKSLPSRRDVGGYRAERLCRTHPAGRAADLPCDDQLGGLRALFEELHQLLDGVLRRAPALSQFDEAVHGKVD